MMTKTSWMVIGALAMAGAVAMRRFASGAGRRAAHELGRCEALLSGLDARCAPLR